MIKMCSTTCRLYCFGPLLLDPLPLASSPVPNIFYLLLLVRTSLSAAAFNNFELQALSLISSCFIIIFRQFVNSSCKFQPSEPRETYTILLFPPGKDFYYLYQHEFILMVTSCHINRISVWIVSFQFCICI